MAIREPSAPAQAVMERVQEAYVALRVLLEGAIPPSAPASLALAFMALDNSEQWALHALARSDPAGEVGSPPPTGPGVGPFIAVPR